MPWRVLLAAGDVARISEHMRPHLRRWLSPYHPPASASWDDMHQEALIGLAKAVHDFRGPDVAAFPGFAHLCVTRQVVTFIKSQTRLKHEHLNRSLSLALPVGTDDTTVTIGDLLINEGCDPLRIVIAREEFRRLLARTTRLSAWERECVERHWMAAEPYEAIGTPKSVDNALQRARKKLEDDTRDYVPTDRELTFLLNREVLPLKRDARMAALALRPGARVIALEPRKLRGGRDVSWRGRAAADGKLGIPTWRVTVRESIVAAAA